MALFGVLVVAFAQQSPLLLELERFLLIEQEVSGEVETVRLPALELQPGDVLLESLRATNRSEASLEGVGLVLPVPFSTFYEQDSASALQLNEVVIQPEFSFDMGQTFAVPPLYRTVVVVEDGVAQEREVEVPPSEYTHVRWLIPSLPPEEAVTVSFRAIVR